MKDFALESGMTGDDGKAIGNITHDLMHDHPEKVGNILISAVLDKKSARDVYSQTAMMTRLRSLLVHNSEADLRSKLVRAIRGSKRLEDSWEKCPEWWDDTTVQHSFVLLKQLDEHGFLWIMDVENAREGFGAPNTEYNDMQDMQLTKPSIQIKANQLVRELSQIEDHEDLMDMLKRRKSRGSMDSLAGCLGNLNASMDKKKGHIQTGVMAFFTTDSTKSSSQAKNNPMSSNPANENALNGGGRSPNTIDSVGKRKESPVQADDFTPSNSSETKKAKHAEKQGGEIVEACKA
jgi:hypothetical protein